jgi:hypothetical protein
MDADRFDTLTRALTAPGSRRSLAAALGGAFGLLGLARPEEAAAKSGKCQPKCGECAKCDKGDCDKKNGKKVCQKGKCKPKSNGTGCSGGTCQGGRCVSNQSAVLLGCPPGTTECNGRCVDLASDPLNCGSCGKRCQLNATCTGGVCTCVQSGCAISPATCCPVGVSIPCQCADELGSDTFLNGATCDSIIDRCPAGFQICVGAQGTCQACCPPGSTCDRSTGACLQ